MPQPKLTSPKVNKKHVNVCWKSCQLDLSLSQRSTQSTKGEQEACQSQVYSEQLNSRETKKNKPGTSTPTILSIEAKQI